MPPRLSTAPAAPGREQGQENGGRPDVELQGWEAQVIARCDGTRTAGQLVELAVKGGRSMAEAYATLVGLVSLRILEVR